MPDRFALWINKYHWTFNNAEKKREKDLVCFQVANTLFCLSVSAVHTHTHHSIIKLILSVGLCCPNLLCIDENGKLKKMKEKSKQCYTRTFCLFFAHVHFPWIFPLVLEHGGRTNEIKSKTRTWKEKDRVSFVWMDAFCIANEINFLSFLSFLLPFFLSAVVIPILDQEQDKAIAVLLVSPCFKHIQKCFNNVMNRCDD